MSKRQGYIVTTYRFRLYKKHLEWFIETKKLYCKVADFYLALILEERLTGLSDYELQRQVEILTQGEKRKELEPVMPLPYGKVPLYFRRAALREAAGAARSYAANNGNIPDTYASKHQQRGYAPVHLDTSPVYYKGMYRNFDFAQKRIELKLYNGSSWEWKSFPYTLDGREIPEQAELLSPTIKIEGNQIFLHVPVKEIVSDVRTVKERAGERYLSVSFAMGDTFAACIAKMPDSEQEHILYIRGGKEFRHRRERLEELLKREENEKQTETAEIYRLKTKLKNLVKEQAHEVSRAIVAFAEDNECKVIAVPDYQGNLRLNQKSWLPYSDYGWISRRIIEYTAYKSFQKGIVLCRIPSKGISEACSICGKKITREKKLYECPDGHKGNVLINTARNVGKRYCEKYVFPYDESDSHQNG